MASIGLGYHLGIGPHEEKHLKDPEPYGARRIVDNFRASALRSIWLSVVLFTGWASLIVALDIKNDHFNLGISSTMLSVLGTVIGFVISYRTSSAYDRYWEGRRVWSDVVTQSRIFARLIWFHVPIYINLPADPNDVSEEEQVRALIEKKTMINIIEAFSFSLKHYLRGEPGVYYTDLWPLVCNLPRYNLPSAIDNETDNMHVGDYSNDYEKNDISTLPDDASNTTAHEFPINKLLSQQAQNQTRIAEAYIRKPTTRRNSKAAVSGLPPSPEPLKPARNPPEFNWIDDLFQFLIPLRSFVKYMMSRGTGERKGRKRKPLTQENVPLELTLIMSSYIVTLTRRKALDVPTTNGMMGAISTFTQSLASLERILTTPIPVGYAIHLKHVVWLYLAVLPFQIESTLKWVAIPATAISSFVFLGLLAIGTEIENPFGYDLNDLNMDYFCQKIIHREMVEITSHSATSLAPELFIFDKTNVPFFPIDNRNALEVLNSRDAKKSVERTLRNLKDHQETRSNSWESKRHKVEDLETGQDDVVHGDGE